MLTELSLWHGANRAVGPGGMRYLASLPEPAAPMPAHMTVLVEWSRCAPSRDCAERWPDEGARNVME